MLFQDHSRGCDFTTFVPFLSIVSGPSISNSEKATKFTSGNTAVAEHRALTQETVVCVPRKYCLIIVNYELLLVHLIIFTFFFSLAAQKEGYHMMI